MKKMNKKGFTIVELVIVIAVIAILAAVLIPTFSGVVDKANASAALQTAKSTLTNALSMSSTAQLPKDTKIAVDGYAYNYTGNQLEACDYPTTSHWSLDNNDATADANEFNALIISADSLADGTTLVSASTYTATDGNTMTIKNGAANVIKAYSSTDNKIGCLGTSATVTVKCVKTTVNSTTSTHYYVNVGTGVSDEPESGNYYSVTSGATTTYYPYAAEIYVNSDLDKDIVVFTNFGK